MVVLLMGVAGSGKTTVGRLLAEQLGWPFYDGDDFHPPANVAKMRTGSPLTDADRDSWLDALRGLIDEQNRQGRSAVVACSALKQSYRARLGDVHMVYLKGDSELLRHRLQERKGHFFKEDLLQSQFAALEEPTDAIAVDAGQEVPAIVQSIREALAV